MPRLAFPMELTLTRESAARLALPRPNTAKKPCKDKLMLQARILSVKLYAIVWELRKARCTVAAGDTPLLTWRGLLIE